MSTTKILTFCGAVSLFATPALAGVEIIEGPGAVQPEENVLFDTNDDGPATIISGSTNQTGSIVKFESLEAGVQIIGTSANGQAKVETVEDSSSVSDIAFFLDDPDALGFTEFEFNLFKSLDAGQSVTITAEYISGITGDTIFEIFALDGSGQNYFSGLATDGDYFTSITIDASGIGAQDLRQVRLGGLVFETPTPAIPEPSTWAMLLIGFFGIGGVLRATGKKGRHDLALRAA